MRRAELEFAFEQFYTRFAFTYDAVSAIVSRGAWRAWIRAALPFVRGPRVLELAFGTGNLQVDLYAAGLNPYGIDLSPQMLGLARQKLRARGLPARLARADVCALPFPSNFFSTLVMTFPPGFVFNPQALYEMWRVLEPQGRLVWVDAAFLESKDWYTRLLNRAFQITGGGADQTRRAHILDAARADGAPWHWRIETARLRASSVHIFIASKG